jgi:hypothetical protein
MSISRSLDMRRLRLRVTEVKRAPAAPRTSPDKAAHSPLSSAAGWRRPTRPSLTPGTLRISHARLAGWAARSPAAKPRFRPAARQRGNLIGGAGLALVPGVRLCAVAALGVRPLPTPCVRNTRLRRYQIQRGPRGAFSSGTHGPCRLGAPSIDSKTPAAVTVSAAERPRVPLRASLHRRDRDRPAWRRPNRPRR